MAEYYIASRNGWDTITKVAGGRVGKLNNKMADTLRSVAMKQGIKKTQLGKKLEFYSVNKEQLDRMLDPATPFMLKLTEDADFRPLLTVDGAKMTLGIRTVNSQPEYGRGMDYTTHKKYLKDLFKAVEDSVFKVNEDVKIAKDRGDGPKGNTNNVKVGDVVMVSPGKYYDPQLARVTKSTEKTFWYEFILPHGKVVSNIDYAKNYFIDVKVLRDTPGMTHFVIPYLPNKELFEVELNWRKEPKTGMKRWDAEYIAEGYDMELDQYR